MCRGLSGLSAGVLMSAFGLDQGPGAAELCQRGEGLEADYPPSRAGSSLDFSLPLGSVYYQTLLLTLGSWSFSISDHISTFICSVEAFIGWFNPGKLTMATLTCTLII